MKKAVAMVMVVVMMLALGVTAFAAHGPLTVDQAKKVALDYAGVKASEATFTKAHRDWDDGREVYEIEFYANNTEYDMDSNGGFYGYDDDRYDWDDRYDDWDDRYDYDDGWFGWDD